ncbi:MAG: flagellar basal body P-ring protein FlgI [Candidatus Hydrogenedentes bacterium]|nr:flagellar basal body P-ring protein FlgI [Candidatus Hydrogenedentota bacterium]
MFRSFILAAAIALAGACHGTMAIRDLCDVQGARDNTLTGVGIVVGLRGTGDSAEAAVTAQRNLLDRMGVEIQDIDALSSKNVAICTVTATLPPFAKEGTAIDVTVQSIYDAKSLEGGQLLDTFLRGPAGDTVYAVASGPVSVGGFNTDISAGSSVRNNHGTVGRIPRGALVEHEVPASITDGERITLLVRRPSFEAADGIRQAIDRAYGPGTADALSGGAVKVRIPADERADLIKFIADLNKLRVDIAQKAVVVINERTGTIVVGGDVMIKPCQVAHGSLTVKIQSTRLPVPALPFTDADPIVVENADVEVEEPEVYLAPVQGTSAAEVAQALNALRLTPRDMIAIFDAIHKAGALEAALEIR